MTLNWKSNRLDIDIEGWKESLSERDGIIIIIVKQRFIWSIYVDHIQTSLYLHTHERLQKVENYVDKTLTLFGRTR